jgi:hypothetical protein
MTETRIDEHERDELDTVYGDDFAREDTFRDIRPKRTNFAPWHHPVKQRVRTSQWQDLVSRLISERRMTGTTLRYFTLPGPDLLDVRVISEICAPEKVSIEYFGFDAALQAAQIDAQRFEIESALRQAQRITDNAMIFPDQLHDIANPNSQAAAQLKQRRPFDVVNVDACDHLAYSPPNRKQTTFDALQSLLAHQIHADAPWLLFVTTRAEPELMKGPGMKLQSAVDGNLKSQVEGFREALATLMQEDLATLETNIASLWSTADTRFLKLYAVGLAKYILQFFLSQPNHPANVELASACTYRVYGANPDMLALAFRIIPGKKVVFQPGEKPQSTEALEVQRAIKATHRAARLRDLDIELEINSELRLQAARQSATLLNGSEYDIDAYLSWLRNHAQRPMSLQHSDLLP